MTDRLGNELADDHPALQAANETPEVRAPSVCVVLQCSDRSPTNVLRDVHRFGFDHAFLVDAAEPGERWSSLRVEPVASDRLYGALRDRLSEPGETVMLLAGGSGLDRFNWLDLVPQLALRPGCSAAVAMLSDEPGLAAAALIRDSAVDRLARIDPLVGFLAALDSVAVRYDAATVHPGDPRPAVFFDRDGVINADRGYVGEVSRFAFLPGAIAGVKAANDRGALAFLVTNQSGVARGYYSEQDVADLHRHMTQEMRRQGAHFDDIRICPHLADGVVAAYRLACRCRKPEPGMLLDLMRHWQVERTRSVMIGDKDSDVEAARAAGLTGVLYRGGSLADLVVDALAED